MLNKIFKFIGICIILCTSQACIYEADVQVQNKVHNAKLENITFANYHIASDLLPGETSETFTITEVDKDKFPKVSQVEFYMTSNGKRVYLKTKASYKLNEDETLLIVIADSTEVINPLLFK